MTIEQIKVQVVELLKLAYIQGGIDTLEKINYTRDDHNEGNAAEMRKDEECLS